MHFIALFIKKIALDSSISCNSIIFLENRQHKCFTNDRSIIHKSCKTCGRARLKPKCRLPEYLKKYYCPEFYEVVQQTPIIDNPADWSDLSDTGDIEDPDNSEDNSIRCKHCNVRAFTVHCLKFHEKNCQNGKLPGQKTREFFF